MRYKPQLPIAVLAAAALLPAAVLALPAAAAADATPFPLIPAPAGEVQHTVTETTFQSNEAVPGKTPWRRIEERWVSATASRTVLSNAETGQLISECAGTASSSSCYDAEANLLLNREGGVNIASGQS
jgi:hypothetical protein